MYHDAIHLLITHKYYIKIDMVTHALGSFELADRQVKGAESVPEEWPVAGTRCGCNTACRHTRASGPLVQRQQCSFVTEQ